MCAGEGGILILDSVSVGESSCVIEVELLAMSFIIAVLAPDSQDLVFCSEGKALGWIRGSTEVTEDTTFSYREDFLKSLALNPRVCIAFGGRVLGVKALLKELLPGLPWHECKVVDPPTNFADSFAVKHEQPLCDLSLSDCRDFMKDILSRPIRGNHRQMERLELIRGTSPILGGEERGIPALYIFKKYEDGYQPSKSPLAYCVPPRFIPSARWNSPDAIVHGLLHLESLKHRPLEEICLEIVELMADHSFTCNKDITFRRLSGGFVKEGREILSNTPRHPQIGDHCVDC